MEKFFVEESPPLKGSVKISGSKNSVLPILAATLLTDKTCVINDVPNLSDVSVMNEILCEMGSQLSWNKQDGIITTKAEEITKKEAPYELVSCMRASFLVMGPLLARTGKVKIPLPGGCAIGTRPVELHLKGIAALGAQIQQEHGYVVAKAKKLSGGKIYLDFPSVGATENIIMAATLAHGQTILENCAVEPEIVDLANFINSIGGEIRGAGTDTIRINGVRELKGGEHTIIPDRIEAGTFMLAAAITRGDITLENIVMDHLKPVIAKLSETNTAIEESGNGLRIYSAPKQKHRGADIKTMPYPGFPTDMQAPFMSLLALSEGTSVVTETIFENRFMHVGELKRMGADIKIESRSAIVEGVPSLTGSQVKATDLRAGAALILSGLTAQGVTEISNIYHVDRGYYNFDEKLRRLGARITRDEG